MKLYFSTKMIQYTQGRPLLSLEAITFFNDKGYCGHISESNTNIHTATYYVLYRVNCLPEFG